MNSLRVKTRKDWVGLPATRRQRTSIRFPSSHKAIWLSGARLLVVRGK